MFQRKTYIERRKVLKEKVGKGLVLLFGNDESPMNYTDNTFHFRQDSTFLYYFGIQHPGMAAIIDIDNDLEIIFGDDFTIDDIVFMGPKPTIEERAQTCGVERVRAMKELAAMIEKATLPAGSSHCRSSAPVNIVSTTVPSISAYPSGPARDRW